MTEQYEGIVNPPIDTLLEKVDSKYALVLFAAKRARQINAYYSQLHEGLFEYVGPLVDTKLNEKPLSISMREIEEDLLESTPMTQDQIAAEAEGDLGISALDDSAGTDFAEVAFSDEGVGAESDLSADVAEVTEAEVAETPADEAAADEDDQQS
ncbi:DNA-directed RNA polymerase subunit omega [Citricoccus sp. GCM10030269]|uniref:DNA-directed RNA polymerase subunit omega n=1 Tax=Citricoccus sp. GCM10030269 TaxID=3273388 RepID=UPI00362154D9